MWEDSSLDERWRSDEDEGGSRGVVECAVLYELKEFRLCCEVVDEMDERSSRECPESDPLLMPLLAEPL